jgi:hypothetical protein
MHVISEADVFKLPLITRNFTVILGNWRTSSKMKLARFRKPKATFSLMCGKQIQYKHKQYYKTGHAKGTGRLIEGS